MRQLKIQKQITNRESQSLDKYLQEIGKVPLLSVDEEAELARRIRQGDEEALEKLVKANLRFVVSVAKQYQNQGLPLTDLISEGNLGLIKLPSALMRPAALSLSPMRFGGFGRAFSRPWLNKAVSCAYRSIG